MSDGLGHINEISGEVVGLSGLMRTAARTPEYTEIGRRLNALRGFNDLPVPQLSGSSGGTAVYGPPPGTAGGALTDLGELGAV